MTTFHINPHKNWLMLLHFFTLIQLILGSGIAVHLSVLSRVHQSLPEDIQSLYPQLLAGAFFPDAFYNCFKSELSDLAEEAHWPDFLKLIVSYAYETNLPLEEKNELKAFIYGLYTHQIADISWHSLHLNQGLLKAFAVLEFDGDIDSAHTFLDTGGDFLLLRRLMAHSKSPVKRDIIKFFETEWAYPTTHLLRVFEKMGYKVNLPILNYCMLRGYSALQGELKIYDTSSVYYSTESPFLDDNLDSYYFGGLQDIAQTIQICFEGLNNWFLTGPTDDAWAVCGIFVKTTAMKEKKIVYKRNEQELFNALSRGSEEDKSLDDPVFLTPYVPLSYFGDDIATGNFLGGKYGDCIAVGAQYEENDGSIYVIPIKDMISSNNLRFKKATVNVTEMTGSVVKIRKDDSATKKVLHRSLSIPPRFGFKLVPFNLLDLQLLIVSSPGESTISIYHQNRNLITIYDKSSQKKVGSLGAKEFGLGVFIDDVNDDGINDIILSSPLNDVKGRNQQGEVIILDGYKILKILTGFNTHMADRMVIDDHIGGPFWIEMSDLSMVKLTLPSVLEMENSYERFGSCITATEKYLIIGTQSIGSVMLYDKLELLSGKFPRPKFLINKEKVIEFNSIIKGSFARLKSKDSGSFGSRSVLYGSYSGIEYFIVSAHTQTISNCLNCGFLKLYVIDKNTSYPKLFTNIIIPMNSGNSFSKFGYNGVITDDGSKAYISGPGYLSNRGSIWAIDLAVLLSDYLYNPDLHFDSITLTEEELIITGQNRYTGFGESLGLIEHNDMNILVVGLPYYGYDELWDDKYKLTGKVGIYKVQK